MRVYSFEIQGLSVYLLRSRTPFSIRCLLQLFSFKPLSGYVFLSIRPPQKEFLIAYKGAQ
ncbi:hypothetical protein ACVWVZ_002517 [Pseudomonas tolaasii]